MPKATQKEESRKDVPPRKGDKVAAAQPAENRVQIEELLDFSFVEVTAERRVALANLRTGLSCS